MLNSADENANSFLTLDENEDPDPPPEQQALEYSAQDRGEATAPLTNPLAFHVTDWIQGLRGEPRKYWCVDVM